MLAIQNSLDYSKNLKLSNEAYFNKSSICPKQNFKQAKQEVVQKPSAELIKAYYLSPNKSINFQGVKIIKINENFKSYESTLEKELSKFEMNGDNASFLGQGLWAETFRFENVPFVVKKLLKKESELPIQAQKVISAKGKDMFDMEIEGMQHASAALSATQKFVAKAVSDDGVKYLISTMVKGHSPDPEDCPWTRTHFKSLFNTMFKLDKEGVYHGDLNSGNIKMTNDGDVTFLDYQWTTKVDPYHFFMDKDAQEFPRFRYLENDQMFQMSGLASYLHKVDDEQAKGVFKDYLQEKSEYHNKRKVLLEGLLPSWQWDSEKEHIRKAIDFEYVQSELFKNPTEDVLSIEAQKLDLNGAMRTGFTLTDKMIDNNNLLAGPAAQFYALHSAQKFRRNLSNMKSYPNSNIMGRYINHNIEETDYWIEKQKSKVGDAFHFIKEDIKNNLALIRDRDTSLKDFSAAPILASKINPSLKPKNNGKISLYYSSDLTKTGQHLKQDDKDLYFSRNENIRNIKVFKNDIKDAFAMSAISYKKDRHIDSLTSNIYGYFCAENYKSKLKALSQESSLSPAEKKAIESEKAIAHLVSNRFLDLSNKSFDDSYKVLSQSYDSNYPEYTGMNDFSIGLTEEDINYAKSNFMS